MCYIKSVKEVKGVENAEEIVLWGDTSLIANEVLEDSDSDITQILWEAFDTDRFLEEPELYYNMGDANVQEFFNMGVHISLVSYIISVPFFVNGVMDRHEAYKICAPCSYGMEEITSENENIEDVFLSRVCTWHQRVSIELFEYCLESEKCIICNAHLFCILNDYNCFLCNEL